MRRLCRATMAVLIAAAMLPACGSTGNENDLVLEFVSWDGTGLMQPDPVSPGSADVDIVQDCCAFDQMTGDCTSVETFTETSANAIFRNLEKLDITLDSYVVDIPDSGLAPFPGTLRQVVDGMRCSSDGSRSCASPADCELGDTCSSSETTINVKLFTINDKLLLQGNAGLFGKTYNLFVTFFGHDSADELWQVTAPYQASFRDFDNCGASQ